jgi:cytochrome c553
MSTLQAHLQLVWMLALLAACSRTSSSARREPTEAPPGIGYGTVMADLARRFELLGRASTARRFELADYQLGEIAELFEETLAHASPPREGHPEVLPAMAHAFFQTNVPDLRRALATQDRAQAAAAFERTATACNACHQASGHGFIEVPLIAGQPVPNTEPIAP